MSARNPRSTRGYTAAVKQLKARGQYQSCWRCGKELWAAAPKGHELSITLGHIIALEDGGSLLDPRNHAAECMACNYADGAHRTNRKRRSARQLDNQQPTAMSYRNPRWN